MKIIIYVCNVVFLGRSVPAFPARVESRAAAPVYLRAKIIKIGLSAVFILFFNCCLFLKTAGSVGLPCRVGSGTGRQAVRRVCGMPSVGRTEEVAARLGSGVGTLLW